MAATVYCQPIQMRTERVLGFDMAQANRWRWRPEYEGLDLGHIRQVKSFCPTTTAQSAVAVFLACSACCSRLPLLQSIH